MTLEEWLKGNIFVHAYDQHLNRAISLDEFVDCCWVEESGDWWIISVLSDGTAITYSSTL